MNPKTHAHRLTRRALLRRAGLLTAALGTGAAGLAVAPRAHAGDYKALVCIFLYGGNDGANSLVPHGIDAHARYAALRGALAVPRASLVPLEGLDHGLHPQLQPLQALWQAGQLAPVFNVGPLVQPLERTQYASDPTNTDWVPEGLFSHPDQRVLWESGGRHPRQRSGWGGRAAQTLGGSAPVVLGDNQQFATAEQQAALTLPGPGELLGGYGLQVEDAAWAPLAARQQALLAMHQQAQDNDLAEHYAQQQINAFSVAARLASVVKALPGEATAFALIDRVFAPLCVSGRFANPLAAQLYQVAKLVHGRATMGSPRQLFLVQMEGFDTHAEQVLRDAPTQGVHAQLLAWVAEAQASFHQAMQLLGLADAVTSFTQSEFGRTLLPNASLGTDHGWGSHHWVVGAAVQGGRAYGQAPDMNPGGPQDAGAHAGDSQGRWIPSVSVEQYAATLLGWLGLDDQQVAQALPEAGQFSPQRLGFLRPAA